MKNPARPTLHLDHLALRAQFSSAIWGVREIYGLMLQKGSQGWFVDLIPEDYEDESSGPFIYHPHSEAVWEVLQAQRFQTRKEAMQAIALAWEIQALPGS
jgi:hypothetical protein